MYISFFQNLVHTFFSFNCFFFKYFFCLFRSRLWSHIFLQKYDEVFSQWSNLKKIFYRMKRKLLFFLQNMPYESWHKGVFWEQTLLKAPRRTILPLTVVNYHKIRYHKMVVLYSYFSFKKLTLKIQGSTRWQYLAPQKNRYHRLQRKFTA